jgi:hypothetical protein
MLLNNRLKNRAVTDRRSPLDRRTLNLGPKFPNSEERIGKERRQHWEKRTGWKPLNRWSSSPLEC